MYCVHTCSSASSWKVCCARELAISSAPMRTPLHVSYWRAPGGRPFDLAAQNAAGLEHAPRFAKVIEDHFAAGDVLEDRVGVDEIELVVRKHGKVGARADGAHARWACPPDVPGRQADHLVGNVHAVDLRQSGGSAGASGGPGPQPISSAASRPASRFSFAGEIVQHVRGGGEELGGRPVPGGRTRHSSRRLRRRAGSSRRACAPARRGSSIFCLLF